MSAVATVPRKTARKAKGDGHLRRAEILEAAERIFVAEGYEGATIRKIADEVGVSSTALYMHFQDKGCILAEICERTFENLLARNSEIAQKPLDAVVRTRMMLDAYMRWGLGHPNAYQLVYCTHNPTAQSAAASAAPASAEMRHTPWPSRCKRRTPAARPSSAMRMSLRIPRPGVPASVRAGGSSVRLTVRASRCGVSA